MALHTIISLPLLAFCSRETLRVRKAPVRYSRDCMGDELRAIDTADGSSLLRLLLPSIQENHKPLIVFVHGQENGSKERV